MNDRALKISPTSAKRMALIQVSAKAGNKDNKAKCFFLKLITLYKKKKKKPVHIVLFIDIW